MCAQEKMDINMTMVTGTLSSEVRYIEPQGAPHQTTILHINYVYIFNRLSKFMLFSNKKMKINEWMNV